MFVIGIFGSYGPPPHMIHNIGMIPRVLQYSSLSLTASPEKRTCWDGRPVAQTHGAVRRGDIKARRGWSARWAVIVLAQRRRRRVVPTADAAAWRQVHPACRLTASAPCATSYTRQAGRLIKNRKWQCNIYCILCEKTFSILAVSLKRNNTRISTKSYRSSQKFAYQCVLKKLFLGSTQGRKAPAEATFFGLFCV